MSGYYDVPVLKAPVWTWEVPAYFFVGGAAGAAALIAAVARTAGAPAELVRDARWMAAGGAVLSPALLISDLGRPERFLNMLRVFKLRSPMSVGAWTLVAFSNAAFLTALADARARRTHSRGPALVADAAGWGAAAAGLVLSTYTGVLIGATAIPVWARHATTLPLAFGFSSVASAASLLELAGHRHRGLHRLAAGAALGETLVEISRARDAGEPQARRRNGLIRAGAILSGPVPLALRILAPRSRGLQLLAAASAVAGSTLTRAGWLAAGRESAARSRP